MKNVLSKFTLAMAICLLVFSACKKEKSAGADALKFIPQENLLTLSAVNMKSLMDKADYATLKDLEGFKEMVAEANKQNPMMASILNDPQNSGINMDFPLYYTTQMGEGAIGNVNTTALATVKDVDKIEEQLNAAGLTIEEKEGFSLVKVDRRVSLAFNDELIVAVMVQGFGDPSATAETYFKENPEAKNIDSHPNIDKVTSSIGSHDIVSMVTTDFLAENNDIGMGIAIIGVDPEDFRGGYLVGTSDFNKGEMVSESEWKFKGSINNFIDPIFKNKPSSDLSGALPAEGAMFTVSTALSTDGLRTMLKERPMMSQGAAMQLGNAQVLDNALQSLNGDMAFAMYEKGGLMVAKIDKEEEMNKLLQLAIGSNNMYVDGDLYKAYESDMSNGNNFFFAIHNGFMYASDNRDLVDGIKSKETALGVKGDLAKGLKGHIVAGFFDANGVKRFISSFTDTEMVAQIFKSTSLKSGYMQIDDNSMVSKMEMERDDVNSLRVLIEAMNDFYLKEKNDPDSPVKEMLEGDNI